mgnify:CR=1 FL=1
MNLLMVDDDAHVLESIQKRVKWERLGIDHVYKASYVSAAKIILRECRIDLLLCDIEMPQESGLDLLAWIREKKMNIQVMMLTSYAEFDYAQRAISLECLEYFLKPVDYEKLEKGLLRAVQKMKESMKRELQGKQLQWDRNSPEYILSSFWNRILTGIVVSSRDEIEKELRMQHIPYSSGDYFALCILRVLERSDDDKEEWRNRLYKSYKIWGNSARLSLEAIIPAGEDIWYIVFERAEGEERPDTVIAAKMIEYCNNALGTKEVCALGDWCILEDIYDQAKELLELIRGYESDEETVICQWDFQMKEVPYCISEIENWEKLLIEGRIDSLKERIRLYLRRQEAAHAVNRQMLKQFRLDLTQMFFTYLRQCGIQAHMVFHSAKNDKLHRNAVNSVEDMWIYVEYLLVECITYKAISDEPKGAIEQVTQYINNHYGDELSRDTLADMVYLNPDYLSRKFKEEKGVSISSYIIEKRVEKAKERLCTTSMPINAVAMEVGYDNFAYFAKVFRTKTGLSPNEYRKQWKGQRKGDFRD